jgi:hypothetical protein
MKKLSALLTIFALFTSQTFAWVGGPYSSNTADGVTSGIFQYTVRGTNVSGMSRFSQNVNAAYNSQFGDSVIYYNGVTYYGESYGIVDFAGGTCDGVINVNAAGADLTNPAAVLTSAHGTSFGVFNGVRYGLGNPLIGGVYSPGGPEATHMTGNGTWTGTITRKHPVPRFSGAGVMTFFGEGESSEASFDRVSVATGELIVAPATLAGRDPFNFTQRDYITVPSDAFKGKTTIPITVLGGRISTAPYLGPFAFQAL